MAARQATKTAFRQVKPILSVDRGEAKKRVLNLYKAWYRQMPYIGNEIFIYSITSIIFFSKIF